MAEFITAFLDRCKKEGLEFHVHFITTGKRHLKITSKGFPYKTSKVERFD